MVQSGRMFTFEMKSQFVLLLLSGIFIIAGVLILIIGKYASALSSLIIVPIIGALIAGFGEETAGFAITGIKNIAPVAAMFVFAILFFGILTDAGMFDPIIRSVLQFAGQDPVKIVISAALLSMLVHLDGSGAVTFLIVIPAMLPLFDKTETGSPDPGLCGRSGSRHHESGALGRAYLAGCLCPSGAGNGIVQTVDHPSGDRIAVCLSGSVLFGKERSEEISFTIICCN